MAFCGGVNLQKHLTLSPILNIVVALLGCSLSSLFLLAAAALFASFVDLLLLLISPTSAASIF